MQAVKFYAIDIAGDGEYGNKKGTAELDSLQTSRMERCYKKMQPPAPAKGW